MLDWLDYRSKFSHTVRIGVIYTRYPLESKWYQWIRRNTYERLPFTSGSRGNNISISGQGVWKERKDAESNLRAYLSDIPSMAFDLTCDSARYMLMVDQMP